MMVGEIVSQRAVAWVRRSGWLSREIPHGAFSLDTCVSFSDVNER